MPTRNITLMCMNTPVLEYNVDDGLFDVLNEKLLPYPLKDKFRELPSSEGLLTKTAIDKYVKHRDYIRDKNNETFNRWLQNRLLPVGRENSKRIALALGSDPVPKMKLIYLCRGLSLTDNYWLKLSGDNSTWKEVNLREVSLSEAIAYVALHGTSASLQTVPRTPEVTNQGAYAKAWLRRDGALWLYKKGANQTTAESRIEVMVSNILDKCNVRHVAYEMSEEPDPDGVAISTCCRCKCITDDTHMILSAMDYNSYCLSHDLKFDAECKRIDPDLYYKMIIVDYLTANRDRHLLNWGFFVSSIDNHIYCMHPLFDHNNAFDIAYMNKPDSPYQAIPEVTMREAALDAIKHVEFHFTEAITRDDFITQRQYEVFTSRAKELQIKLDKDDMLNWCKKNAPESVSSLSDVALIRDMHDSWLNYLRNEYGAPCTL